jgi:glycerophosphoryl diester phosphodiesterase
MIEKLIDYRFGERPMVVAHRGNSGLAPENTMAAIRQGVEAGAEMVEIDVQITADDRLIVFHDPVLGRTTNGSGRVSAHTYEEIARLDAGSWMSGEFKQERVPLLLDVLEYLRGRAYLNIELKRYDDDPDVADRFIAGVLRTIEVAGMMDYALLSSFDHPLLARVRAQGWGIPYAVILHPEDRALPSERALPVGAQAVVMSKKQLSHGRVADAVQHRLPLGIYTINTVEDARRAARYGVQAVVTNFPGRIIESFVPTAVES